MDAIKHKIQRVDDRVCQKCSQCWFGECRAFEMAHSKDEYEHRMSGVAECMKPEKVNEENG